MAHDALDWSNPVATRASISPVCARPAMPASTSARPKSSCRTARGTSRHPPARSNSGPRWPKLPAIWCFRSSARAMPAISRARRWTPCPISSRRTNRRAPTPSWPRRYPLNMLSPKAHAFLNSSYGNMHTQLHHAGGQMVMINPGDAAHARNCSTATLVRVYNDRGAFQATAQAERRRQAPASWSRRAAIGRRAARTDGR